MKHTHLLVCASWAVAHAKFRERMYALGDQVVRSSKRYGYIETADKVFLFGSVRQSPCAFEGTRLHEYGWMDQARDEPNAALIERILRDCALKTRTLLPADKAGE